MFTTFSLHFHIFIAFYECFVFFVIIGLNSLLMFNVVVKLNIFDKDIFFKYLKIFRVKIK